MNPNRRNPGFVSRRGDDRRIIEVVPTEPGRWDVFWADGASVSLIAPNEDVARLRAQLRRDENERALDSAVTAWHRPSGLPPAPPLDPTPPIPAPVGSADFSNTSARIPRPSPRPLGPAPTLAPLPLRAPPPPRPSESWLVATAVAVVALLLLSGGLAAAVVVAWLGVSA